jgi:hypothetical protein
MLRKNENGQQPWLPAVLGLLNQRLHRLPVSATTAAVETATSAMEAAATAAAAEASAPTVETSAAVEAARRTVRKSTSADEATTTHKSATTHESPPTDEPTTEAEATAKTPASPRATPAPPGAGPDEHSTREPIRPIVAVRRTSVRRIAVVAVVARRRTPHIARSKPHAHTYLRL